MSSLLGRAPNGSSGRKAVLIAFVAYLVITVAFTYPLVVHPASTIEWGWGDPLLVAYIVNWGQHALVTHPTALFDAPFYYPSHNTLSLSEHLLSVSWPLMPLAVTGEPLLVYNSSVFLSFFLSALAFFLLLRRVGIRDVPAWLGGLLFGFLPWRYGHLGHAQMGYTWWIPCTLLALESWLASRTRLRAAAVGAGFAAVFLSSAYHGFFFAVFLVVYGAVRLVAQRRELSAHGILALASDAFVAAASVLILLAPSLVAYRRMAAELGVANPLSSLANRGADPLDYLSPPSLSFVWGSLGRTSHPYSEVPWEMHAFPGALALLAFLVAPLLLWGRRRRGGAAVSDRSSPAFWAGGLALFLVSLGPTMHFATHQAPFPGPYALLYRFLPGFGSMRVPARASFYIGMAGAALAAAFLDRFANRQLGWRRRLLLGVMLSLGCLDVLPNALPYRRPEEYIRLRAAMQSTLAMTAPGVDLVLPINDRLNYAAPLASVGPYRQLLNGKSGYLLPRNGRIFDLLSERPFGPRQVELLRTLGVTRILVDRRQIDSNEFEAVSEILRRSAVSVKLFDTVEDVSVLGVRW